MNIVCNNDIYAAIRYDISESVEVYIDSSFDNNVRGISKHQIVNLGSGFSMVDKHGRFAGYGVASIKRNPSTNSQISELGGILYFFDIMKKHFPNEYNENTKFIVRNDNLKLMRNLSSVVKNNHGTFDSPTGDFLKAIGSYRAKVFSTLKHFNVEFEWVKGHADNHFNVLAHNLAYRSYSTNQKNIPFIEGVRMSHIKRSLNVLHESMDAPGTSLVPPVLMTNTIGEALKDAEK